MIPRTLISALLGALALAGCATGADERYPSLAIRDVERAEGQFEPIERATIDVPEVEVDLTGGLGARLEVLVGQATAAHASFTAAAPRARRLAEAARGAAIASPAWADAQVALADLDSARSRAAVPLGDLDTLYVAASVANEERAAIQAARAQVVAMVLEEDRTLDRLRGIVR